MQSKVSADMLLDDFGLLTVILVIARAPLDLLVQKIP